MNYKTISGVFATGKARYLSALVVILLLSSGIYAFSRNGNRDFEIYTVAGGTIVEEVSVIGSVKAAQDVELSFQEGGIVGHVYTTVGTEVRTGEVLAMLDNAELAASRDKEAADLAALVRGTRSEELAISKREVENAKISLNDAGKSLEISIQNAYTQAESSAVLAMEYIDIVDRSGGFLMTGNRHEEVLNKAAYKSEQELSLELKKWKSLLRDYTNGTDISPLYTQAQVSLQKTVKHLALLIDAISDVLPSVSIDGISISTVRSDLVTSRSNVELALSSLTTAQERWRAAELNYRVSLQELALDEAGSAAEVIAAQEAAVRQAQARLDKTIIRAPFDGIVTRMNISPGESVEARTAIAAIISAGNYQVDAYIPEVEVSKVSIGNSVEVNLDAYGQSVIFPATVQAIDLTETTQSGVPTYKTTIVFESTDERIRSGMTANALIKSSPHTAEMIIPAQATFISAGKPAVRVLTTKGEEDRTVTLGRSSRDGFVEVLSGLTVGERILVAR